MFDEAWLVTGSSWLRIGSAVSGLLFLGVAGLALVDGEGGPCFWDAVLFASVGVVCLGSMKARSDGEVSD